MGKTMQPGIPILEEIENRIDEYGRDKIWGMDADWSNLDIDSDFEAELLVYDSLLNNMEMKTVCTKCIIEDDRLFEYYYGIGDEDEDEDIDLDYEF